MELLNYPSRGNHTFIGDYAYDPDIREKWSDTSVGDTIELTHKQSGRRFQYDDNGKGGAYTEVV